MKKNNRRNPPKNQWEKRDPKKTDYPKQNKEFSRNAPVKRPAATGPDPAKSFERKNPNRKNERLERAILFSKKYSENKTENVRGKEEDKFQPKKRFKTEIKYGRKKQVEAEERKPFKKKQFDTDRGTRPNSTRDRFENKKEDPFKKFKRERPEKFEGRKIADERFDRDSKNKPAARNERTYLPKKKKGGFLKRDDIHLPEKNPLSDNNGIRLNKYLANAGIAARRKCDEFIAEGLLTVNGKVVKEMGHKVMPGDRVHYKNKLVQAANYVYILLNKPKDYLTTVEDDRNRHTVMELIADATGERVYPVGRLDRNTTGLLLLTNDGDLAQKLSHPSFGAQKVYEVEVDKSVSPADIQKIADGVELEDGVAMVDGVDYAHHSKKNVLGISLHVGKNRIVRRIFESLGYRIERLDRTYYAGLTKRDLPRGRWRYLTQREVIKLKYLKS